MENPVSKVLLDYLAALGSLDRMDNPDHRDPTETTEHPVPAITVLLLAWLLAIKNEPNNKSCVYYTLCAFFKGIYRAAMVINRGDDYFSLFIAWTIANILSIEIIYFCSSRSLLN